MPMYRVVKRAVTCTTHVVELESPGEIQTITDWRLINAMLGAPQLEKTHEEQLIDEIDLMIPCPTCAIDGKIAWITMFTPCNDGHGTIDMQRYGSRDNEPQF